MPRSLPKTDVVIVGMGAAGGVAALPLTNAGLKVVGLEAGGWLNPRDFAPDELRNNIVTGLKRFRRRLLKPLPYVPIPLKLLFRWPSHDECSWWYQYALLGPELAVESMGLQSG